VTMPNSEAAKLARVDQYAERDAFALDKAGGYYMRHLSAMTAEGLHAKSDIAAELAWRDMEIDRLRSAALAQAEVEPVAFTTGGQLPDAWSAEDVQRLDTVLAEYYPAPPAHQVPELTDAAALVREFEQAAFDYQDDPTGATEDALDRVRTKLLAELRSQQRQEKT
jgi:predicted RNase H-like nuclease